MNGKVHNYYEAKVFDELDRLIERNNLSLDQDQYDDIACIALNQLPPRYVRFDIDTTFYATPEELQTMQTSVEKAIDYATNKILTRD